MSVVTLIGASYGLIIATVLVLGRTAAAADPFMIEAPLAPRPERHGSVRSG